MTVAALQATISLRDAAEGMWDAVVIGAGPAGSVVAMVLARWGQRVLLVDRAAFPREKVCGCCLSPAAVETLNELGLGTMLDMHHAAPMDRFDLRIAHRRLEVPMRGGRVISRSRFDTALAEEAIAGGAAFLPHCLASIGAPGDMNRPVHLNSNEQRFEAKARLILAAGGLGFAIDGSNQHHLRDPMWSRSRLGGSAIVADDGVDLPAGTVRMIVARRGYVGFARLEDDRLAVGGAFDPSLVRDCGGLAGAAARVLGECRIDAPEQLAAMRWLGAPQLTRRPARVATQRVLAVGDAAGFVEPFTGEGMTWAIQTARGAAALAGRFMERPEATWSHDLEHAWTHTHRSLVRSRHRRCRVIAQALRHPMLLAGCMMAGRLLPRVSRMVVERIHAPGAALSAMTPLNPSGGKA